MSSQPTKLATKSNASSTANTAQKDDAAQKLEKLEVKMKAMFVKPLLETPLKLPAPQRSVRSKADIVATERLAEFARNLNNTARVANSHLTSAEDKLAPLHSLKTGRVIDRFPGTAKEIGKLTDTLVDAMLLALEVERTGSKEQKAERLRVQIGLKPNPA